MTWVTKSILLRGEQRLFVLAGRDSRSNVLSVFLPEFFWTIKHLRDGMPKPQPPLRRVNVGCGRTPTPGWLNFDNSMSVRLAKAPKVARSLLLAAGLINREQRSFIEDAAQHGVEWADASRLPLLDGCASVIYTSHMLEHLDRRRARRFLSEARRVLSSGGILRIAVPDLRILVERYQLEGDADGFVASTHMAVPPVQTLLQRVRFLATGFREHAWMYDGLSLSKLLAEAGFVDIQTMAAGKTKIPDPGALNLREREHETVYVEAVKP